VPRSISERRVAKSKITKQEGKIRSAVKRGPKTGSASKPRPAAGSASRQGPKTGSAAGARASRPSGGPGKRSGAQRADPHAGRSEGAAPAASSSAELTAPPSFPELVEPDDVMISEDAVGPDLAGVLDGVLESGGSVPGAAGAGWEDPGVRDESDEAVAR